jgi:hypothetical protein
VLTLRFSTICALPKMGNERNSLRSDNGHFLSIFGKAQIAKSPAEVQIQNQQQRQNPRQNQWLYRAL